MSLPKFAPANSKLGRQVRSATSGSTKERNKYAPKVDPLRAQKLAAWNADIDRKLAARQGKLWHWKMNLEQNGMLLVDRDDKEHKLQWAEYPSNPPVRYVQCVGVSYPISVAQAENVAQTAEEIVNRIVSYLNERR